MFHEPGHLIDIMATAADLAGATYPATYKGNDILPMEAFRSGQLFPANHSGERTRSSGSTKATKRSATANGSWSSGTNCPGNSTTWKPTAPSSAT